MQIGYKSDKCIPINSADIFQFAKLNEHIKIFTPGINTGSLVIHLFSKFTPGIYMIFKLTCSNESLFLCHIQDRFLIV